MGRRKKSEEETFEVYQVNEYEEEDDEFTLYEEDETQKKGRKKKKKKNPPRPSAKETETSDGDFYEFSVENRDYTMTEDEKIESEKKMFYRKIRIITFITIYILFITVGVITTTYSQGTPQSIGVKLREMRQEFYMIENHFNKQLAVIYELKQLDEKVDEAGAESSFIYAVSYKDFETLIENNVKEVQGAGYSSDYEFMRDINVVIYDNLFKYASLMSDGLSAQSMSFIQDAQNYKKNYNTAFEKYVSNLNQFRELVGLEEEE